MSKLMNDLASVNLTRKTNGIVIDDTQEDQKQAFVARESKGTYFIGFLIVMLVVFSALSMSAGLKTLSRLEKVEMISASTRSEILSRLEKAEAASTTLLHASDKQGNEIQVLKSLIADKNSEEMARITGLQNQVKEMTIAIEEKEKGLSEITVAHHALKTLTQDLIDDLKMENKLMSNRYILLNDKVKRLTDANSFLLND